jgi:hypothetical protein
MAEYHIIKNKVSDTGIYYALDLKAEAINGSAYALYVREGLSYFNDTVRLNAQLDTGVFTTGTRDLLTPRAGTTIFNSTTGMIEFYDGTAWVSTIGLPGANGSDGTPGGDSEQLIFSTSVVDSNPGSGYLRFNHVSYSLVSEFFISTTGRLGNDITNWLDTFDASSAPVKGVLRIYKRLDPTHYVSFTIVGANITASGYIKVQVAYVLNNNTFANDDQIVVSFTSAGTNAVDLVGDISGSGIGTVTTTLATVNSNVGTFGSTTQIPVLTVNGKGLVTAVSTVTVSGSLSFIGDVTGTGNTGTNTTLTLATVNSNVGTFGSATKIGSFTVNGKGLITAASEITVVPDWANITNTPTTVSGYGITDVYTKTASDARFVNLSGSTITGPIIYAGIPSGSTELVNKSYVDNLVTGLSWKQAVRAATTVNITLSGAQTIDGVSIVAGDRVLVKNQSTQSQNGIYVAASGSWSRSTDSDTGTEVIGSAVYVETGGTVNGSTQWVNSNSSTITIGSTSITFSQISGAGTYTNGTGLNLSGNVFSLNTTYTDTLYVPYTGANATINLNTQLLWLNSSATAGAFVPGLSLGTHLAFDTGSATIAAGGVTSQRYGVGWYSSARNSTMAFITGGQSGLSGYLSVVMQNGGGAQAEYLHLTPSGLQIIGTINASTITASGSTATIFLTSVGGEIQSRTASQVLSDIGAAPAVGGGYVPYTGATANVNIGTFGMSVGSLTVTNGLISVTTSTNPTTTGTFGWSNVYGTYLVGETASTYDSSAFSVAGSLVWGNPVGTNNIVFGGTATVSGLAAGSAGNFVVNGGSGLLVTRTAAQVVSDLGVSLTGSYVPYTGASSNVDLGTHTISGGTGWVITGSGLFLNAQGGGGAAAYMQINTTGGNLRIGTNNSTGTTLMTTTGYASVITTNNGTDLYFGTGAVSAMYIDSISHVTLLSIPSYSSGGTYLVSNSGTISSRTGAQVLSDIGAQATLSGSGYVKSASGTISYVNTSFKETPTGTIDGSNAVFTIANTPVTGSEHVYVNGVLQEGGGADYTLSTATITFVAGAIPPTGSRLRVTYLY